MRGICDVRLRIQCVNDVDHAKILPMASFFRPDGRDTVWAPGSSYQADLDLKRYFARRLGEIICGSSPMYIYKPGDRSPIGRCILCGGELRFEIQELAGEMPAAAPMAAIANGRI